MIKKKIGVLTATRAEFGLLTPLIKRLMKAEIVETIKKAVSDDFRKKVQTMTNPFGDGDTSEKITEIIRSTFEKCGDIGVMKVFYDLKMNE